MKDRDREKRNGEKGWMEGGRNCHTTTQIFHTHTHTLSLTIITAHMSLQKEMGIVVKHTHTKQGAFLDRPGHLCTMQVRCAGATQTPKARARSSQEVPTVPPIGGVGTRSPTTTISGQLRHSQCAVQDQVPVLQMSGLEYNGIV